MIDLAKTATGEHFDENQRSDKFGLLKLAKLISISQTYHLNYGRAVGFGPGVAIQILAAIASTGSVAGVDYSQEMVEQATTRNAKAIAKRCLEQVAAGIVQLHYGSVEKLPFADDTFDRALAINSMQVWSDEMAGLREIRRVMTGGGKIALAFTSAAGQSSTGLTELLTAAGFIDAHLVKTEQGFCVLATK